MRYEIQRRTADGLVPSPDGNYRFDDFDAAKTQCVNWRTIYSHTDYVIVDTNTGEVVFPKHITSTTFINGGRIETYE